MKKNCLAASVALLLACSGCKSARKVSAQDYHAEYLVSDTASTRFDSDSISDSVQLQTSDVQASGISRRIHFSDDGGKLYIAPDGTILVCGAKSADLSVMNLIAGSSSVAQTAEMKRAGLQSSAVHQSDSVSDFIASEEKNPAVSGKSGIALFLLVSFVIIIAFRIWRRLKK